MHTHTGTSLRLTEPAIFLRGGVDRTSERAARRRAHARTDSPDRLAVITQDSSQSRSRSAHRQSADTPHSPDARNDAPVPDTRPPAVVRGLLTVHLTKPTRIRKISVKLTGTARTEWPEGLGPRRMEIHDENIFLEQTQLFFDASKASDSRRAASVGPCESDANKSPRQRPAQLYASNRSYSALPPSHARFDTHPAQSSPLHDQISTSPPTSAEELEFPQHIPPFADHTRPNSPTWVRTAPPSAFPSRRNSQSSFSELPPPHFSLDSSNGRLPSPHLAPANRNSIDSFSEHPRFTALERPAAAPKRSSSSLAHTPPRRRERSSSESSHEHDHEHRFSLHALAEALKRKGKSRSRSGVRGDASPKSPMLRGLKDVLSGREDSETEDEDGWKKHGWKEFKAGTYTYPVHFTIPVQSPPTMKSDFGSCKYHLKGTVHRAGALTSNLVSETDVMVVACPGEDDMEESESIIVERFWETQLGYRVALSGKSFHLGGSVPISVRLNPLDKISVYRISVILEERTSYFAHSKAVQRNESAKKHTLLRIDPAEGTDRLLPILSDSTEALDNSPLKGYFVPQSNLENANYSLLDPLGPWQFDFEVPMPTCHEKLHFTNANPKSNITVLHTLKVYIRVDRGDSPELDTKGNKKKFDIIIETPLNVLSCRYSSNSLPAYSRYDQSITGKDALCGCPSKPKPAKPVEQPTLLPQHPTDAYQSGLQFARLVEGSEAAEGDAPPTYNAALQHRTAPPLENEWEEYPPGEEERGRSRIAVRA